MATAEQMIDCSVCIQDISAFKQNALLSITLLSSITAGFGKLFHAINSEADKAKTKGVKLNLTFGDRSLVNAHRHSGTEDCPAMFKLELEPDEWRVFTKRIVSREIYQTSGADYRTLESLVTAAEKRQDAWHESCRFAEDLDCHDQVVQTDDCSIFKLTGQIRSDIGRFEIRQPSH